MNTSIFDLFKIGIGPSSSHTMGPMYAVLSFMRNLKFKNILFNTHRIKIILYGSLAWTGKGHQIDKAILLGLSGHYPETVDISKVNKIVKIISDEKKVIYSNKIINFDIKKDLIFNYDKTFDFHSNAIEIVSYGKSKNLLKRDVFFSIGGGFIQKKDHLIDFQINKRELPNKFSTFKELFSLTKEKELSISDLLLENEAHLNPSLDVSNKIKTIWDTMHQCIKRGLTNYEVLPGSLKVHRRSPEIYKKLINQGKNDKNIMDWVNIWAMAVNEENAGGGRIVTAPTNGAAGIIPAVIMYFDKFLQRNNTKAIEKFILTAGAIGLLYKNNASISGAEVGCQGEVGVACSMASGGLVAAMGGSTSQIENAAEIGMEHNLGLTCDPIGGLVQIPCIERNAMGAVKAINAARMALLGDGNHKVSLDQVINTMFETGKDMQTKYKETSLGGLAVNFVEC